MDGAEFKGDETCNLLTVTLFYKDIFENVSCFKA